MKHGLIVRVTDEHASLDDTDLCATLQKNPEFAALIPQDAQLVGRLHHPEHGLLVLKFWHPSLPPVREAECYPQRVIGEAYSGETVEIKAVKV